MQRRAVVQALVASGGLLPIAKMAASQTEPSLISAQDPRFKQAYMDGDMGQIFYWCAGTGPNLVLIHQSGNSSEEYAALVPLLADRYRLIAIDLPGHGRSDDPPREPTVDDFTDAVYAVLQHLGVNRTHLLGHHGGALTAMNLAARYPRLIDKTILSGTGGVKTPEQNKAFLDSLLAVDTTIRGSNDFVANAWDRYVEMMSDGAEYVSIMPAYIAFLSARLRPYRAVSTYLKWDRRKSLSQLRGPVLLVQGEKDAYVSGQAELLKIIPNSNRLLMPGCGTFAFYDRPDACGQMISDYLEG